MKPVIWYLFFGEKKSVLSLHTWTIFFIGKMGPIMCLLQNTSVIKSVIKHKQISFHCHSFHQYLHIILNHNNHDLGLCLEKKSTHSLEKFTNIHINPRYHTKKSQWQHVLYDALNSFSQEQIKLAYWTCNMASYRWFLVFFSLRLFCVYKINWPQNVQTSK